MIGIGAVVDHGNDDLILLRVTGNYAASGLRGEVVQSCAQWSGGEVLFPKAWGQLGDAGSGVLADTLQDIDEVGIDVDLVQATSDDQAARCRRARHCVWSNRSSNFCAYDRTSIRGKPLHSQDSPPLGGGNY